MALSDYQCSEDRFLKDASRHVMTVLRDVPLYPAPPQRKPLTEEEIDSIWGSEKAFADIYAIVRAIERAHGIGGNDE